MASLNAASIARSAADDLLAQRFRDEQLDLPSRHQRPVIERIVREDLAALRARRAAPQQQNTKEKPNA